MASSLNGTGLTFSSGSTLNSPPVTSIATGNGLSGGTITTTGTLALAAPAVNTIGSYVYAMWSSTPDSCTGGNAPGFGSNYAAGTAVHQMQAALSFYGYSTGIAYNNILSGTWKWMAGGNGINYGGTYYFGIAVRVA